MAWRKTMSDENDEGARPVGPSWAGAGAEPASGGAVPAGAGPAGDGGGDGPGAAPAGGRGGVDELRRRLSELGDPLWALTNLFVFSPSPLLVYGADGRCLLANDAFRRVAGADPPPEYRALGGAGWAAPEAARRAFAGEPTYLPPAWYAPREPLRPAAPGAARVALETNLVPLRGAGGRVAFVLGLLHDRTDEMVAKERLEAHARQRGEDAALHESLYRIGAALNAGLDLPAVVQKLTDEATALCGAAFGAFFHNVTNAAGESYMLYTLSGVARSHFERFPMPRNTAVFAPTFAGGGVVRSDDITRDARYGRNPPHRGMPDGHLPVRSYLAVPVVARSGEVLGGLFLGHHDPGVFTERAERLLAAVAPQAAVAIDKARLLREAQEARAEAEAELRERERREADLEALARASTRLGTSLDLDATLRAVAACFVPERADWSNVYLRRDDGSIELAACAHADPAQEAWLRAAVERAGADPEAAFGPGRVLRTRRPELLAEVDDGVLGALARGDGEALAALRALGAASWMTVPLLRDGVAVGAVTAASTDPARRYDRADLRWAEEVARRAVAAVENARLFELAQRERRRAEEANRAKDEFLAVVSHELRTPLTAILGWSRMLSAGALDGAQRERAVGSIERNAKAQAQLVEDLLDVSRIITGKLKISVGPVDLARCIEAALDVVRPAAEAKGVRLQPILDRGAGPVMGDADRLQQVVWNLLSNAVKFTPRGGRVVVRLERSESSCLVVVEDTGQGIEADFLPYVFERFRQAEAATTRVQGGLGLGLAIARHLVELHGGTIEVHSEGPGRGAAFAVRVPVAPLRRAAPPSLAAPAPGGPAPAPGRGLACPPPIEGLRVLVVDDEPDARELLAAMLAQCKAEVRTASSAAEALELLRAFRPDVLVSDVGMPGEDGYSLLDRVRALAPGEGGRTPAVALTAYARSEDRSRALLAGFNMHVAKPIDPTELLIVLANVAGRLGPRPG
ncbi:MAG TPA: ATP-binding protein [Polyangiaceae bacterium]|nr:ATP-binding protein [Polyangiaceae bacterium]